MTRSMTLRASASAVGVHLTTSFRWRHRYLNALQPLKTVVMTGLLEVAESWILCADTAPRFRGRPRRRPRRTMLHPLGRRSWLCCMRDRSGRSFTLYVGEDRPSRAEWAGLLEELTYKPTGIIGQLGPLREARIAAREFGIPAHRASSPLRNPVTLLLSTEGAVGLLHRLRRWVHRFRGVTRRYLSNYILWHDMLDVDRTTDFRLDRMFCWPLDASREPEATW